MEAVRTCVGCRARAPRSALLRVVQRDGVLVADEKAVLPGRGAWVHDTDACVAAALRRRAFGRALRVTGALDTSAWDTQILPHNHQRKG
ncbi:MAG: YlxR family protein [Microbacterium sp.]|uniref:YlxR family protein n=1 Tax=Microbacterium sp. TaxID=51671 RepID=UPI001ACE9497|nr:YlxR family protein [Microbacterium sp.]MBN9178354.1 YlxR family protein [Microbacterium sp.]